MIAFRGCYSDARRTYADDDAAMRDLIDGTDDDTTECEACLGSGGSWSYPNAMSSVWHPCDDPRCIDGRIPL